MDDPDRYQLPPHIVLARTKPGCEGVGELSMPTSSAVPWRDEDSDVEQSEAVGRGLVLAVDGSPLLISPSSLASLYVSRININYRINGQHNIHENVAYSY